MKDTVSATQTGRVIFGLVAILAPWFYLRWGGFTFSVGTSLSLVDLFLFVGVAYFAVRFSRGEITLNQTLQGPQKWLFLFGSAFVLLGLLSGFTSVWADNRSVSWGALLSGLSQYAFVLLALPVVALAVLGGQQALAVVRILALGYLLPMLANLLLLNPEVLPQISFMFTSVGRAIGSYGNANSFAGVIALVLPYHLYLAYVDKGRWQWVGIVGAAISLSCLLLTASFGGFLVVAACVGANLILIVWKGHPLRAAGTLRSMIIPTSIILAIFVCVSSLSTLYAPSIQGALFSRLGTAAKPLSMGELVAEDIIGSEDGISGLGQNVGSMSQRLDLIGRGFELIGERGGGLFYGHGLRQTTMMDEFVFGDVHLDIHLVYQLLWVEGGAVFALTFVGYLTTLLFFCLLQLRSMPGLAIAAATSVVAFGLMGMVMPHLYLRYFWVPLMPAMALAAGYFAPVKDMKKNP
jgi:hypothetical protein